MEIHTSHCLHENYVNHDLKHHYLRHKNGTGTTQVTQLEIFRGQ
jgi:hypothetical protein